MGRNPLPEDEKMSKRLVVLMTEEDRNLIYQWQAASGEKNVSALVQPVLLDAARIALKGQ